MNTRGIAVSDDRIRKIKEFFYGFYAYEFERQALEMRGEVESAFMLITFGDMLGVPVMPPLQALRLLPFVVPELEKWKRRVLRERDLSDKEEFHLHGV
jgi:predicted component of type VI protein secretion system